MTQIKKKIDKLPLIIRSIIYGMIVSTCAIGIIILILSFIYLLYEFALNWLTTILDPIVSVFIIVWILMTLLISIVVFIESKRRK